MTEDSVTSHDARVVFADRRLIRVLFESSSSSPPSAFLERRRPSNAQSLEERRRRHLRPADAVNATFEGKLFT